VSAQLFLPESWTQDAERRKQARVPEEITEQTKPEIALSLLDRARHWGVPIQAVVVDAGYGDNPNFLRGLDERQIPYICAVESTFGCRLPDEVQAVALQPAVYQGRGQRCLPRPAPLYTVKELIAALPASAWQTISWREGTKGTSASSRQWLCASTGPPAPLCIAPATVASTRGPKAGGFPNARWLMTRNPAQVSCSRRQKRKSNIGSVCCLPRLAWSV